MAPGVLSQTRTGGTGMKYDYEDNGIRRRVSLPDGDTYGGPEAGIPLSLDVDSLYPDATPGFRRRLVEELWAVGMIEPCDFMQAGAAAKITAALQAVVRADALDIITMAHKRCNKT
jgi:hypothetical protein